MRTCTKCHVEKPDEVFPFKAKAKGVRHSVCSECRKAYCKTYYAKDPEFHRARSREWIANNLAHKRTRNAAYMHRYRQENGPAVTAAIAAHYQANKAVYKLRAKLRTRKDLGWIDAATEERVRSQFNHLCFKCGGVGTDIDHHLAVKDGGHLVPGNMTLLCGVCNNKRRFADIYSPAEHASLDALHQAQIAWFDPRRDFQVTIGLDPKGKEMVVAHHYSQTCPGSRYAYTLRFAGHAVGVCTFARPSRQNIKADLELSRFFVMPGTPTNTESYFLGAALREVAKAGFVGKVVTFADPTEGHQGTIYRASNWTFTGYTAANYHYATADGTRVHKRQVWNRAKAGHISEREQAAAEGLSSVPEAPKLKFEYVVKARYTNHHTPALPTTGMPRSTAG